MAQKSLAHEGMNADLDDLAFGAAGHPEESVLGGSQAEDDHAGAEEVRWPGCRPSWAPPGRGHAPLPPPLFAFPLPVKPRLVGQHVLPPGGALPSTPPSSLGIIAFDEKGERFQAILPINQQG